MPNIAHNVSHPEFEEMVRRAEEADGPRPESAVAQIDPYEEPDLPTIPDVEEQYGLPAGKHDPAPIIPEGVNPAPGQSLPPGFPQPQQEGPSEPVNSAPPADIPPPLPGFIPRPEEAPVEAEPVELSAADNIIDAADADIYEAEVFADASPFGDLVGRATEAMRKLDFEDDGSLPPAVQEAGSHISGTLHNVGSQLSNIAHQVQDSVIEAADEDVHDAAVDTTSDTDPSADDPYADGN